jgi:hypothetical protein
MTFEVDDKVVIGKTDFDEDNEREETKFEGETGTVAEVKTVSTFTGTMEIYEVILDNKVKHEACAGNSEVHSWPFYESELSKLNV